MTTAPYAAPYDYNRDMLMLTALQMDLAQRGAGATVPSPVPARGARKLPGARLPRLSQPTAAQLGLTQAELDNLHRTAYARAATVRHPNRRPRLLDRLRGAR